jgi:phytoene dehydrogenase-like protein
LTTKDSSLGLDSPASVATFILFRTAQFATISGKYNTPPISAYIALKKTKRDVIIVGGGHNGLVAAAYLTKSGFEITVLERRHCVGGAAVTEQIIPGFKFSRASYLAGLLRPHIIKDLELEKYGFKYLPRNPSSFTPTLLDSEYKGQYLLLGDNEKLNYESIAQFSKKDAIVFPKYEAFFKSNS